MIEPTSNITLAAITRIVTPIVGDIYKNAKNEIKTSLQKWNAANSHKKIAKKIYSLDQVRTILNPNKDISLRSFYFPSKIHTLDGPVVISDSSDLGEGNHIIQGIVGQGKSMLARHLALQDIQKKTNQKIPIFIELRKINNTTSLEGLIYKYFTSVDVDINNEVFSHIAKTGNFLLILDGFD